MKQFISLMLLGLAAAERDMQHWNLSAQAISPCATVDLRFALKAADPQALDKAFEAISTPGSAEFRKYLTDDQVRSLVAPEAGSAESVVSWINNEIINKDNCESKSTVEITQAGDHVLLKNASIEHVKEAFQLDVQTVIYKAGKKSQVRAQTAHTPSTIVPEQLKSFGVSHVTGLVESPLPVLKKEKSLKLGKQPGDIITPPVIHKQYQIPDDAVGGKNGKVQQGVAGFEDEEFKQTEVDQFTTKYSLPKVTLQVLGPNDGGYFGEGEIDTQYVLATGRGMPTWWLSQELFDMTAWCELVMGIDASKRPSVLSVSWGSSEANYSAEHIASANSCFQKMGAAGISIFVASGDAGTGKQGMFGCKKFAPVWPASSPWVTAVGGTYLADGVENGWNGSGGGFSAVHARPAYQEAAASAYLKEQGSTGSLPDDSLFTKTGRAIPDVSAFATNFLLGGGGSPLTGTSAACPTFAGMVSVINDMLATDGKAPVGFINPVLYQTDAGTYGVDITTGNNKNGSCKAGFPATKGWDPVTGLGTPVWNNLKTILVAGPGMSFLQ